MTRATQAIAFDRYAPLVRDGFPAMPRRVSGYNLPDLLDENRCHVGRALVGSESTCVMILGAKLRLMRARPARGLRVLVKRLAGIAPEREVPRIERRSFGRTFRPPAAPAGARRVMLWPDTFYDTFCPSVLHDAVRVLGRAGFSVEIPRPRLCCGRPLYEYGFLDDARRLWDRTLDELADDIDGGVPLVGLEPSCVAAFRDELPALFPGNPRAERLSKQTHTLGEFLVAAGFQPPRVPAKHILYHRHCHQAAVLAPEHDIALLRAAGHDVEVLDSGCCGMAGAFGFQRTNYELSVALAERVLLPAIRADPSATVVADGFSCREQLRQLGNVRARHLAELLTDLPVLA